MAYSNPSVAEFQTYFNRDFNYGTDMETDVLDSDIAKAFQLANINFNPCLWDNQGAYTVGYLLLSAHYLVSNIQASSQGVNGQFNFPEQSKSVGSVSQSFSIPERLLANPYWTFLMKTPYGAEYLQLIMPQLCGTFGTVFGRTRA